MEKLFKLKAHGTTIKTELLAGITTFLTMAYILAVNPGILGDAGMNSGMVFTATALASAIATILMAVMANLPIALAPGMGLNAFFTYTVVLGMGYSPEIALTAVFLEGIMFIVLSFFKVREAIIKSIPANLKRAVAVGIGIFITLIGMKNAGIIVDNPATLVALGDVTSGTALLALIGLVIIAVLHAKKVHGAILIGILATTVIGIPMGITAPFGGWSGWKPFSAPPSPYFFNFDFSAVLTLKFFTVFFAFLFVDIFDTVGTLVGVTTQAGLTDKDGNIPRVKQALLADAVGTSVGAALGTSTVTSYIELFRCCSRRTNRSYLPVYRRTVPPRAIPLAAVPAIPGPRPPALILVGFLMMKPFLKLTSPIPPKAYLRSWRSSMMPFCYSIAEGIVFGVLSYVVLKVCTGKYKQVTP